MTEHTPATEEVRDTYSECGAENVAEATANDQAFDRWLAQVKLEEREHMLAQIMEHADYDPDQRDEYGRIEIAATVGIYMYELTDIARTAEHDRMSVTVDEWEEQIAAAEQRGAYRAACQAFRHAATAFDYPEATDQWCTWADVATWLRANADKHDPDNRADQIEGDNYDE